MKDAGSDAFNAIQHHSDGTVSVRTGFVPVEVGGYVLPGRDDPDRIANKDVYALDRDGCMAELERIDAAVAARAEIRAQGVRDVIILKDRGSTSFEDWAEDRRREITKRMLYGR